VALHPSAYHTTARHIAHIGTLILDRSQMVLLKDLTRGGLVFFTNYASEKARHLTANPRCSVCIYWRALGVQIRISAMASRLPGAESDAYWATRSRDSQ
jgi:pyridoxamine 5'-phosphate oxidase